jgi:hypothetical protein
MPLFSDMNILNGFILFMSIAVVDPDGDKTLQIMPNEKISGLSNVSE